VAIDYHHPRILQRSPINYHHFVLYRLQSTSMIEWSQNRSSSLKLTSINSWKFIPQTCQKCHSSSCSASTIINITIPKCTQSTKWQKILIRILIKLMSFLITVKHLFMPSCYHAIILQFMIAGINSSSLFSIT
jgi:hypothetical protein